MQTGCPLLLPAEGLGHRIIAETGDLVVIPLVQANAGPIQQINSGEDLHADETSEPILQLHASMAALLLVWP